jgi:integrase/recombinase XerD
MKASKTEHKGEERIKVDFPYNQAIATLIKQIEGARWSKTMNAWHIPYGKKEFDQLKALIVL